MSKFTVTGTIVDVQPVEHFETFKKRNFTIQTEGDYPTFITLQLYKDNVDKNPVSEALKVTASCNVKGYKGKTGYFNILDCWKVEI